MNDGKIVYVIIESRGEYSEREEWVAGVYTDKDAAISIAEANLELSKTADAERDIWFRKAGQLQRKLNMSDDDWHNGGRAQVVKIIGEPPNDGICDCYYITSVPVNTWGRWDDEYRSS